MATSFSKCAAGDIRGSARRVMLSLLGREGIAVESFPPRHLVPRHSPKKTSVLDRGRLKTIGSGEFLDEIRLQAKGDSAGVAGDEFRAL